MKLTDYLIICKTNVVLLLTNLVIFTLKVMHLEKKRCCKTNNKYIYHDQAQGFFRLP